MKFNRKKYSLLAHTKKPQPIYISYGLSGWQDSNLRPPAPKAGALTGLRYTPNFFGGAKVNSIFYFPNLIFIIFFSFFIQVHNCILAELFEIID
jgi:hypothetical protein